ncbi:serine carboxypeptidase [Irpex lacteus]|nr:serine carboxypeptidase [Irpex lacteus]
MRWCLGLCTVLYVLGLSVVAFELHAPSFEEQVSISPNSSTSFTTLKHASFPNHAVRVKKTDFCDSTVGAYTGYIDIEARHLFFYFFESRRNATEDDVVLWTNGCSGASMGLFMELGPCKVAGHGAGLIDNPWSWNELANVIFIDQPIGTGFSYADHGEYVNTTEEAAKDVAVFVAIFFEYFSHLQGNKLHLAGESYGGRYLPVFASEIHDSKARFAEAGLAPINLDSIIMGNPCSDMQTMYTSYYEVQCQHKTFPPVTDISRCVDMKRALPRCEKWLRDGCYDHRDLIDCEAAVAFCEHLLMDPFRYNGMNPYDLSKPCEGVYTETLCYPITKNIAKYLEDPDVRKKIGVDSALPSKFTGCAWDVRARFRSTQDHMNGRRQFSKEPLKPWDLKGNVAGQTRSMGPLTYATIRGAGHMAPYDKPEESFELIKRWLAHRPFA